MSEEKVDVNGITIDKKVALRICQKLILKENINIRTKEKNDGQMVKEIQNLIQEEVACY